MKIARVLVIVVVLLSSAVVPVFSEGANCGCSFTVTNKNHTQVLGGKSGHSSHGGLHVAAANSSVVTHTHK